MAALVAAGALFATVLLGAGPATAETFRVVNVPRGDVLNVRSRPSARFPVVGTLEPGTRGVEKLGECIRGWCPVRQRFTLGWASARFLALERRRPPTEPRVPDTLQLEQTTGAAVGTVLPDGTLEKRLPDGRVVRILPNGQQETHWPDGRVTRYRFSQVQTADLPPLPGELSGWGGEIGDELLAILENILTPAEMEAYLQTEVGRTFYDLVDWRLSSIEFLTTPGS